MELEDQILKPSNKRKTDSEKNTIPEKNNTKHNPKTSMSSKDVQNSIIEMEEGNPSPNQLMDSRIQNSLEEPGTEPEVKTLK